MKLATEKKLQRHMIRFLMIDSQQTAYNAISQALEEQHYTAQGKLLDDINSFEKALNLQWDAVIFNNAYDFDYKKAIDLIDLKSKTIPLILLSDLDASYPEILEAYQLGVYVVASPINYSFLTLNIYRASVYTRLVRRETQLSVEIDQLQQQTQSLVETTEHAVAVFQDGVHVSVNDQYIKLFNSTNSDDFLGQPILDILQPTDIQGFKTAYKRLSKDDFSQASFNIESANGNSKQKTLMLQFAATEFDEDPALQLVIPTEGSSPIASVPTAQLSGGFVSLEHLQGEITGVLLEKSVAGLFIFRINSLPESLLLASWDILPAYFKQFEKSLAQHFGTPVFRLAENTFVLLKALDTDQQGAQLLQENAAKLPASIDLDHQIFSLHPKNGYIAFNNAPTVEKLRSIINDSVQRTVLASEHLIAAPSFSLDNENAPLAIPDNVATEAPIHISESVEAPASTAAVSLGDVIMNKDDGQSFNPFVSKTTSNDGSHQSLLEQIDNNTIELQFQQLYDKEDIDTHIYEVTASFTHDGNRIDIANYGSLNSNPELAVKLDRWILVEASKRLHQFLHTCPKARIVVNLHAACFNDASLVMLLTKLVNLINSKYTKPLILQFPEDSVLTDMDHALKFFQAVQEYGVAIAISEFGKSAYSTSILTQAKILYAKLAPDFSDLLQSDDGMVELQEKLDEFQDQQSDLRFVLTPLDDMTMFANAWNVSARYLQGNYFQAKHAQFVDNAG